MAIIPGATGTTTKAVDGLEGPTAGSPVSFPSGFSGNFVPTALADANATLTSANSIVVMTPTANRVLTLPSSVPSAAFAITIINRSASFTIAVNASGGGTVVTVGLGQVTVLSTQTNPTTTAHWTISTNNAALQGGNSFGAAMLLGTNDNFGLDFETNGTVKVSIGTAGNLVVGPAGSTSASLNYLFRLPTAGSFIVPTGTDPQLAITSASSSGVVSILGYQNGATAATGLSLAAWTKDGNTGGDFVIDVRENDNSDFATLTNDAFKINRFGTNLINVTRAGAVTLGPTSAIGGTTYAGNNIVGRTNGSAVGAGYVGERAINSSLSRLTTSLATYQLATGNYGTPTAGRYLVIFRVSSAFAASLTHVSAILNTSNAAAGTGIITQVNIVASATLDCVNGVSTMVDLNGSQTLYLWGYALGANTTITGAVELIRIA